ncbi:MAG: peptidoglycan editing factor PgeF [Anaerolineales bacterium]|nr:peptidoglycan editing factor PgeF [Anaerolineales bacterium]
MQPQHTGALRYYQFGGFDSAHVTHAVFTRHGGVSPAPYGSLNLSVSTGDAHDNVRANRLRAFQALGRAPESVADLWQVHSARVVVADTPNAPADHKGQADTLITDRPEVTLLLRFADCVPILLYDPRRPAVGLVHAGWRGTLQKAVGSAVQAMTDAFGSRPGDIMAAIGPSIGPCHYQVGLEVVAQTRAAFQDADDAGLLHPVNGGHHLDLWAANAHALRAAGVEYIEQARLCTVCHQGEFFSHRAQGAVTGRFGALIGLNA